MIVWSLAFRIAKRELDPLPVVHLNESDVPLFVKTQEKAVIFFGESFQPIKALKRTIEKYHYDVRFGFSPPTNESKGFCLTTPCASAFIGGRHIRSTVFDLHAIGFEFWVKTTFDGDTIVSGPEQLRRVLQIPGSTVLAFDMEKRPAVVPKDVQVFMANSDDMKLMGIPVKKGVYVFRTADRELLPITRWDYSLLKSPLAEFGVDDIREKEFLVAAFVDGESDRRDQATVRMMTKLAEQFGQMNISFGIFTEDLAEEMGYVTRLSQVCGPLVVVLNTSDLQGPRWVLTEAGVNERKISGKLQKIINGRLLPSPLSAKPTGPVQLGVPNTVTVKDYKEKVLDSNSVSVVFLVSSCRQTQQEFIALQNAAAVSFKKYGVQIFVFDQGIQDVLDGVPLFAEYPQILGYKGGKANKEPLLYQSDLSLMNFLEFMREITGGKADLSEAEILEFRRNLVKGSERKASRARSDDEEL